MATTKFNYAGSNSGRKLRVVAKIRNYLDLHNSSGSADWISVNRENSDDVSISFGEKSSSRYMVDYCYNEHEDNEIIYSREVKPLVSAVFEGHNSTVIANGARGSGKTHVIQGSIEKPGLAVLATSDLLSMAEENGKSIAVSFYEIDQHDHAVDLLNPEQPPILVLEDHGKIQFKGLCQTPVKSIAEFQNLYLTACSAHKAAPRKGFEPVRRSHMGLIVHVISQNKRVDDLGNKMNFVDMAGYEDTRRKSSDGSGLAETNKINKSIYALLNVCYALSTNESRVPYRESKLTRMLQDSLRGTSKILLVSCLNPSFCQDTVYMLSLASRSCQFINRTPLNSTKTTASSARHKLNSQMHQIPKSVSVTTKKLPGSRSVTCDNKVVAIKSTIKGRKLFNEATHPAAKSEKATSQKKPIPNSVSAPTKKLPGSRSLTCEKKGVVAMKSTIKGRKLFDKANHSAAKAEKEISIHQATKAPEALLVIDQLVYQMHDNSLYEAGNRARLNSRVEKENSPPDARDNVKLSMMEENHDSSLNAISEVEHHPIMEKGISEDPEEKHTLCFSNYSKALSTVDEGHNMNEENNFNENEDGSPPISSQLRDLQSLCSTTPLGKQIPEAGSIQVDDQISTEFAECVSLDDQISTEVAEPRTPLTVQNMCSNERGDVMNPKSPWETFSMRSSGVKNSLVKEYLRFLNTAEKEELKKLKGIGEKRATFILELREESPEPFKSLDDLKDIGLSAKQIKGIMKKEVGELFS